MMLSYKYRLKDRRAAKRLREQAIAVNQVWNYCNAFQKGIEDRYRAGAPKRPWPSYFDFTALTKGVGRELNINQQTVAEACRKYSVSRDKNKKSVRFRHSFGGHRSLGWVPFKRQSRQIKGNSITYLGKTIRWFGNKSRPLPENAMGGEFIEDSQGRWWVVFHAEVYVNTPSFVQDVGIDLGLKAVASLSDGTSVPSLKHYRAYERKLATAQRSRNKGRVRRIHTKIANARRDQHHKTTTEIVRTNSFIAVGNVSSSALAKTRMAKSIYDAGWYSFKNMLIYKCQKAGAVFMEVDERYSSQTCSECGSISGPKGIAGLGIRSWVCPNCGVSHDRDTNAARNILKTGLSAQALAEGSRVNNRFDIPDKHEPPCKPRATGLFWNSRRNLRGKT